MIRIASSAYLLLFLLSSTTAADSDPARFFAAGQKSEDARLARPKTLNDYFPMKVPGSKQEWEARRKALREQVLVGTGLWPMPKKTPLKPVIHGKIDAEGFTIAKVFFASYPGFYVTGSLYRPMEGKGKRPGVLCPHGHWANGRFYDAGEAAAKKQIKDGAEKWIDGARNPIQARCAQLARMGCVVFQYDMVGYADSTQLPHRQGFTDVEAALHLQNFMGLQTWNSVRALDFLLSLPDVDKDRIAVTGASGGGTQTFMLCAIDDRPDVAFPAVMVSTAMQGGCICENCSYLRQDAGNIDLAALCAPRPLGMTGARDWTIDIEKKGLPELKQLYAMLGAKDKVTAKCFPQFGHNYNQVSRAVMYNWLNRHLGLNLPSTEEKPFKFRSKKELTVFTEDHPRPKDAVNSKELRAYMTRESTKQLQALKPKERQEVLRTALSVMLGTTLPKAEEVEIIKQQQPEVDGKVTKTLQLIRRKGSKEQVPALWLKPKSSNGQVILWIHPEGKSSLYAEGKLVPAAQKALDQGTAILAIDALGTGEQVSDNLLSVDKRYVGYTFGYNRPLLSNRAHDILTAVGVAQKQGWKNIHLVGFKKAGPWALLARGLCGDAIKRTSVDANQYSFTQVKSPTDEMMLPGALKYGDLGALASVAAPGQLSVHNFAERGNEGWLRRAYEGAKDRLSLAHKAVSMNEMVDEVLSK